jgi:hypothetical protein
VRSLRKKGGGWQAKGDVNAPRTGLAALRADLQASSGVLGGARAVFADRSSSRSGKVFTLGEIIADASSTPVGRVLTAVVALTLAYWLI